MSRMLHTGHSMSASSTYNVLRLIAHMICAGLGISYNANCAYDVHGNTTLPGLCNVNIVVTKKRHFF